MFGYLSLGHYLFLVAHSFPRASLSEKTVRFSEQIMSAGIYLSIFSRQMETIVYIISRQMEAIVYIYLISCLTLDVISCCCASNVIRLVYRWQCLHQRLRKPSFRVVTVSSKTTATCGPTS